MVRPPLILLTPTQVGGVVIRRLNRLHQKLVIGADVHSEILASSSAHRLTRPYTTTPQVDRSLATLGIPSKTSS